MTPFNVAIVRWIRRAFDFRTRATRAEYWWPFLLSFMVNLVCLSVFMTAIGPEALETLLLWMGSEEPTLETLDIGPLPSLAVFALTFLIVYSVLVFIPTLSVSFRRFQDLGRPGWTHLIFIVLGSIFMLFRIAELIWFAFPGQRQSNRYGPDPLANQSDIF